MISYGYARNNMPRDWIRIWIKPLHKGGDENDANICQIIMVGLLMAKLFGCMEPKTSAWA